MQPVEWLHTNTLKYRLVIIHGFQYDFGSRFK